MALATASTKFGRIGRSSDSPPDISIFKGIPYATPPVGDLRWRAPQPLKPWEGTYKGEKFGSNACQPLKRPGEFYTKEFPYRGDETFGEDCLYLNIWTPAEDPDEKLPVIFYVHGGGYATGSGREVQFVESTFARKGVILVTINYRLGTMGFLAHPWFESRGQVGNYGLSDQIAALQWVYENIEAFGGDSFNITAMGQSAGAMSIQHLVSAPGSRDLIARAIMQSGGGISPLIAKATGENITKVSEAFIDYLGVESPEELMAITGMELEEKNYEFGRKMNLSLSFTPYPDGIVLPASLEEIARGGRASDIPYLMGANETEFVGVPAFAEAFRKGGQVFGKIRREGGRMENYIYFFTRRLPGDDAGSFHSGELWYTFGSLPAAWRPFTQADHHLSQRMMDAWIHFARTGNPGVDGWRPYDGTEASEYVFDI